jgi:hypothetical protein
MRTSLGNLKSKSLNWCEVGHLFATREFIVNPDQFPLWHAQYLAASVGQD